VIDVAFKDLNGSGKQSLKMNPALRTENQSVQESNIVPAIINDIGPLLRMLRTMRGWQRTDDMTSVFNHIIAKETYVLKIGGTPVGTITLSDTIGVVYEFMFDLGKKEDVNAKYISNLAVSPAHRRQGVGTQLLNFAETKARVESRTHLRLLAFKKNEGLAQFYFKSGYKQIAWVGSKNLFEKDIST